MAKQRGEEKPKRLSLEQAEALVRQSNEAVCDPGPGDFVSKHTFGPTDLVAKVRSIEWFVHCGEPGDFDVTMPIERVKTWPKAIKGMKSRAWENVTLEARNQLTARLSQQHRERYQEWNDITEKLKHEVIAPLAEKAWEPFRQDRQLDIVLLHCVQWDVLAALMENAFLDCKHGCFFFHELLSAYEAGHVPCGWIGNWPLGSLVVF